MSIYPSHPTQIPPSQKMLLKMIDSSHWPTEVSYDVIYMKWFVCELRI